MSRNPGARRVREGVPHKHLAHDTDRSTGDTGKEGNIRRHKGKYLGHDHDNITIAPHLS